jgi:uncharacterized phiE125 gp8 family phage protein
MIEILSTPETMPITTGDVAQFIGIADSENPVLSEILRGAIDDVERCSGQGVGVKQIRLTLWPPVPLRVALPYSPLRTITKIACVSLDGQDETIIYDGEGSLPVYVMDALPARIWPKDACWIPFTKLIIEYEAGWQSLPVPLRQVIMRTCAARYESRSVNVPPDMLPVADDEYLKSWR